MDNKPFVESKYFEPVFIVLILLAEILLFVYCCRNQTILEDRVSHEIQIKEQLIEEQKKLKVETALLESPQHIEAIAKNHLQMQYPDNEQIIVEREETSSHDGAEVSGSFLRK